MRFTSTLPWLSRTATAVAVMALLVGVGGCRQAKQFIDNQTNKSEKTASEEQEVAAEAERLAAEALALEEKAQAEAEEEARLEAEALAQAEAEAEARAAQEELEAAERRLAEEKARLAEREERLRREQALQQERERLAARQAALEDKERELLEHEREIEAREVNVAVAEDELRARTAVADSGYGTEPSEAEAWTEAAGSSGTGYEGEYSPDDGPGYDETASVPSESSVYSRASLQPGKVMEVEMLETISSKTHRLGDTFSGRLVQDLRAEDGTLVIAAGAKVHGVVTEVTPLRKVGGRASIGIEFMRIEVAPGETVEIRASVRELGADKSKDKKKIIGATIAGAILGRVLGGKGGENAVLGAAVGAAAGTAAVARSKGKDAVIPAGEMVALQLEEVVTVEIEMTGPVYPE